MTKKIPRVNEMGEELEKQGLVKLKDNSFYQIGNNCYDIASKVAGIFGFKVPSKTEIQNYLEMRRNLNMSRNWAIRNIPGVGRSENYLYKEKPSLAYLVIRNPDLFGAVHVAFEFKGGEYNYGARNDSNAPIEMRFPLQSTN